MNNLLLKATLLLSVIAVISQANAADISQEKPTEPADKAFNWYIGGQLGFAKTDLSSSEIQSFNQASGLDVSSIDIDDSGFASTLFVGYQFSQYFAVEAGYMDLGDRSVSFVGKDTDIGNFYDNAQRIYPQSGAGASVAVVGSWPLSSSLKVSAKLGYLNWKGDYSTLDHSTNASSDGISGSDSISGGDIWSGVEINYQVNDKFQLYLSAEHFELERDATNMLALGVRYHFGESRAVRKAKPAPMVNESVEVASIATKPIVESAPVVEPELAPAVELELPDDFSIFYPINQFTLSGKASAKLLSVKEILMARDDLKVSIHGYASALGDFNFNQRLSLWRAHSAEKYLYLADIPFTQMHVDFHGDVGQTANISSQRIDIRYERLDKNLVSENETTDISFDMFSARINAKDIAKIQAAVEAQNLSQLHHVELIAFAKPPGNEQGLIELSASRAKQVVKILQERGIKVPILLSYALVEKNEKQTTRKVEIRFFSKSKGKD
jgi:outer membrane protein OmpA-like peptidoglycan-associated protein/opacity protein-like surface antigen